MPSADILREARSLGDSAMFDALMPGMSPADMDYMKTHGPEFWAMLDKMAATDPQAYKEYIRSQIEADLALKTGRRIITPTPGFCLRGIIASVLPAGAVTPAVAAATAAGVKLPPRASLHADVKPSQPLFVNICSHDAVAPPTGPSGASVLEKEKSKKTGGPAPAQDLPLHELLNLHVPVVVGTARPIRGTARTEWAVDVLVHPWVTRAASRQPIFEKEFIAFAVRCTADELGLELVCGAAERVDKFDYAGGNPKVGGGTGTPGSRGGEEPVPFDVTAHVPGAAAAAAAPAPAPVAAPAPAPVSPAIIELGPGRGGATSMAGLRMVPPPQPAAGAGLAGGQLRVPGQQGGGKAGGAAGPRTASVATPAPADVLRAVRTREAAAAGGSAPAAPPAAAPAPAPPQPQHQGLRIRQSPAAAVRVSTLEGGLVQVAITFDPDVVDAPALRMHLLDLDVEPEALVLSTQAAALKEELRGPQAAVDPVVRVRLPTAIDPDSAAASYSRATRTLTVTATPASAAPQHA